MIRRRIRWTGALMMLAAGAVCRPAAACSPVPGYRSPTNLELAAGADTIVIATVTGERRGADAFADAVIVAPTMLLKGAKLPPAFVLPRSHIDQGRERPRRSDPQELRAPNPDSLTGGCVRYLFARGMQLVLFLRRDAAGRLAPWRSPFARDAEDVSGPGALWVRAVREYVAIAAAPPAARPARMRARARALRGIRGDAAAARIAADMDVELSGGRQLSHD